MPIAMSPELKVWLQNNKHIHPDGLIKNMIQVGYPPRTAVQIVESFLGLSQESVEVQGVNLDYLDKIKPLDLGSKFPNYVGEGNEQFRVSYLSQAPRIIQVLDFLTGKECDQLIEKAKPKLAPSKVLSNGPADVTSDVRTSKGTYFERSSFELIQSIEERLGRVFKFPLENAESIQVLNYKENAQYKPHFDFFENDVGGQRAMATGGNRFATILLYLNDVEKGGSTIFPKINAHVMPIKGSALYFDYVLNNNELDRLTMHGGSPVLKGEKWVATQWVRVKKYG